MKASSTVSHADFDNFDVFRDGPAAKWTFLGLVIYTGDQVLAFGRGNLRYLYRFSVRSRKLPIQSPHHDDLVNFSVILQQSTRDAADLDKAVALVEAQCGRILGVDR